jgi:hypothetical protein
MKISGRTIVICCLLIVLSVCLFSCEKPKQAKLIVTEHEFFIKKITDNGFDLCAKGKVKNVGEVDVKRVVVTAKCLSCIETFGWDKGWSHSPGQGKTAEQQQIINYIPTGAEEAFSFSGIAIAGTTSGQQPENMPEQLEVIIVSFEPNF